MRPGVESEKEEPRTIETLGEGRPISDPHTYGVVAVATYALFQRTNHFEGTVFKAMCSTLFGVDRFTYLERSNKVLPPDSLLAMVRSMGIDLI